MGIFHMTWQIFRILWYNLVAFHDVGVLVFLQYDGNDSRIEYINVQRSSQEYRKVLFY